MKPTPRLCLAVAVGGALGAVLRHLLGELVPDGDGFAWTTFAINVTGAFLLALLPALSGVRRSPAWTVALGPGVLGGYTTLSAYAEQSRALLAEGRVVLAATYVVGTFAACAVAVLAAATWSSRAEQDLLATDGGAG